MKTFLLLWILVGGVDRGPPAIPMPDMKTCMAKADEYLHATLPPEVQAIRVGCVQERKPDTEI